MPRRLGLLLVLCQLASALAEQPEVDTRLGDEMIAAYFRDETVNLRDACLADIRDLDDWKQRQDEYRRQLLEMLGLDPPPEKSDLQAVVTATTDHDAFRVERLQFQSRPGLYVTANLYLPREISEPLPAILYVCGHGGVKQDGVSYGNKVHYQHHGGWFARNGYVCLTIDTLQLGEIEGIHHGTYREGMWWWLNRGYTPAGVEAWNCVRAIDYLQSRDEVDADRIGVTGRSGGGAYSWWIAAIDERIKCAVPVAGITDLENHVIDGCVEGHCDCMYMFNTYRWDYPLVAALVAPRPLLIANTDSDGIFPLDGVYRTFEKVRTIYQLHDAADQVGLNITAGGHQDTQELRVHAFRWFNQHLKNDDSLIDEPAEKYFDPPQLRVFESLPADQRNTSIQETFVPTAAPTAPKSADEWERLKDGWREMLLTKTFAGWPREPVDLDVAAAFTERCDGLVMRAVDFTSQKHIRPRLFLAHREEVDPLTGVELKILDEAGWRDLVAMIRPAFADALPSSELPDADVTSYENWKQTLRNSDSSYAYLAPRGIGLTAWDQSRRKQIQHRRRFYLLGQSLDGMRVWDIRRAIQALRRLPETNGAPLTLVGRGRMAGNVLYASLFEPNVQRLRLHELPASHRDGPFLLNVRKYLDLPQAVAMAADKSPVALHESASDGWDYVAKVAEKLRWDPGRFQVVDSAP